MGQSTLFPIAAQPMRDGRGTGAGFNIALSADGNTALVEGIFGTNERLYASTSDYRTEAYIMTRTVTGWVQHSELFVDSHSGRQGFGDLFALSGDGKTAVIGGVSSVYVFAAAGARWALETEVKLQDDPAFEHLSQFGALSSDGNTLLVSASGRTQPDTPIGLVYIFTRGTTGWTRQARLEVPPASVYFGFGPHLALSSTGDVALIGVPGFGSSANDDDAVYVFGRAGTTWSQQARLTLDAGQPKRAENDGFGDGLAISSDGRTALITTRHDSEARPSSTTVGYIFTVTTTGWVQQTTFQAPDVLPSDTEPSPVALSADGQQAVIGAARTNNLQGAALVFARTASAWARIATLHPSQQNATFFGHSVALSANGRTLLIGASNGPNAYVFSLSGAGWHENAFLNPIQQPNWDQGHRTVALSSDGQTALVGLPGVFYNGESFYGDAFVYRRSPGGWIQQGELSLPNGQQDDQFGWSVALSADGTTALIGARFKSDGMHVKQGAAYVYVRSGAQWTAQAALAVQDAEALDLFGYAVALSADGRTAYVGAPGKIVTGQDGKAVCSGAVIQFVYTGAGWVQHQMFSPPQGATDDFFGAALAVSADASTLLVGASRTTVAGQHQQGTAYVYTLRAGQPETPPTVINAHGTDSQPGEDFGAAVALSADGQIALIGADSKTIGSAAYQGAAYVYTRSGTYRGAAWTRQTRLIDDQGAAYAFFGSSVALSADGQRALVGSQFGLDVRNPDVSLSGATAFSYKHMTWTQQTRLTLPDKPSWLSASVEGHSVALSADGTTALTDADFYYYADGTIDYGVTTERVGIAYSFTADVANASLWQPDQGIAYNKHENRALGRVAALSADAQVALVGDGDGFINVFARSAADWTLNSRFTTADKQDFDHFGSTFALSADGRTALVGASGTKIGQNDEQGAAYVFIQIESGWQQQARLVVDGEGNLSKFGSEVALSADGTVAAVSAPGEGAVYIFVRKGSTWVRQTALLAGTDFFDPSGPLALSADGNTLVVGSPDRGVVGLDSSAVNVFVRDGASWVPQAQIQSPDGQDSDGIFGHTVALSADGDLALIGSRKSIDTTHDQEIVDVFTRTANQWALQTVLTNPSINTQSDPNSVYAITYFFGDSLALSPSGEVALIGTFSDLGPSADNAAYVFRHSGSAWNFEATLRRGVMNTDDTEDEFGVALALSASGGVALIGTPCQPVGINSFYGAAYMFTEHAHQWTQQSLVGQPCYQ